MATVSRVPTGASSKQCPAVSLSRSRCPWRHLIVGTKRERSGTHAATARRSNTNAKNALTTCAWGLCMYPRTPDHSVGSILWESEGVTAEDRKKGTQRPGSPSAPPTRAALPKVFCVQTRGGGWGKEKGSGGCDRTYLWLVRLCDDSFSERASSEFDEGTE